MVLATGSVVSAQTASPAVAPFSNTGSRPSAAPTVRPAVAEPSGPTSDISLDLPSAAPTPTPKPTLETESFASERFRQEFTVQNDRLFTEFEEVLFQGLYASYTEDFAPQGTPVDGVILTSCDFLNQIAADRTLAFATRRSKGVRARRMQDTSFIAVDFSMEYTSLYTNVTTYPTLFQLHVNSNLEKIPEQMQLLGLNVSEAFIASRIVIRPDPTAEPTPAPTSAPTISNAPSMIPSDLPSLVPSSVDLPATESPSESPSTVPAEKPTPLGKRSDVKVIAASVVVAFVIVVGGLCVYYRKKNKIKGDHQLHNNQAALLSKSNVRHESTEMPTQTQPAGSVARTNADDIGPLVVAASPSLLSNHSLLSAGNSFGGDSTDEVDATQNLADEFDQYKDQNLEKMRAGVEGTLTGFDGMMSQALTRALIDEDETNVDPAELLWGGTGQLVGMEVEASALGEVTDWLKRNDMSSDDERYVRRTHSPFRRSMDAAYAIPMIFLRSSFSRTQTPIYARNTQ